MKNIYGLPSNNNTIDGNSKDPRSNSQNNYKRFYRSKQDLINGPYSNNSAKTK